MYVYGHSLTHTDTQIYAYICVIHTRVGEYRYGTCMYFVHLDRRGVATVYTSSPKLCARYSEALEDSKQPDAHTGARARARMPENWAECNDTIRKQSGSVLRDAL